MMVSSMDPEDKNTLHNYIQNQISNMPSVLNEELSYKMKSSIIEQILE